MTKQIINIGTSANKGNGDPLRTAFTKVNENFTELYSAIGADVQIPVQTGNIGKYLTTNGATLSWATVDTGGASVTTSATAPVGPSVGDLWYDTASGRTYVYYDSSWVDANPVDGAGISATNQLVNGSAEVALGSNGVLTFPNGETLVSQPSQLYFHKEDNDFVGEIVLQAEGVGIQATHPTLGNSLINISTNGATISINDNEWVFDRSGTLTTPLLLPKTFTAVLDSAHKTGAALTLTDTPWEFTVQFQVNPNGTVETMMNSIFPNLVNPGYTTADQFAFTEADHGIPGYTFELELDNLVLAGPAGWTASPVVSIPPEYPSTVKSLGAVKLTANDQSLTLGTSGNVDFPTVDGTRLRVSGSEILGYGALGLGSSNNLVSIVANFDGTPQQWTFGTTGNITFPDTSTYGNSTLTGAVDSDLALEVKHRTTVSATEISGGSPFFTADITTNDDIIVVQPGWEVNAGTELEPIWVTILTADEFSLGVYNITPVYEEIPVGFEFVVGQSYTFRNPVPGSRTWTIRSQTGGLVGPGGAIVTNETAPLGGGGTYRELAIELPTPDGLNEQRWVFANDGDLTAPGDIFAGSFLGQSLEITDAGIVASTYAGDLQTLHVAGAVGKGLTLGTNGGLTSWLFKPDGSLTLPLNGNLIVDGTTYTELADAETTYTDNEVMYQDMLTQWMTDAAFKPVWFALSGREAYDIIMAWTTPDGITPPPSGLVPLAYACKTSYLTWQDLIADSKLAVKSDTTSFEFDSSGKLKLPQGGTIAGGDPTSVQAAYDAWQATEDDWTYLITTGGTILEPKPWTYAAPGDRQATLTAMWAAQQSGGITLDWSAISYSFYNEVRAWLAVNTNSAVLYNTWKKLSTGVNITAEDSTWSFTYDGGLTFPDATVQTTAFTKNITSDNGSYYLNVSNTGIETGGVFKWLEDTTERAVMNYVAADDRFVISTSRVINSKYWYFGDDGSTTLPSGAGFGLGESGQLKVHDGNTTSLDLRDSSGRGFYTNSDGFSLRSDGDSTWMFKSIGTLNLPNFGAVPSAGDGAVGDICRNGDVLYFKTSSGWATIGLTL